LGNSHNGKLIPTAPISANFCECFTRPENRNKILKIVVYINTKNWYICKKTNNMARNTSILIGDYFENFINEQIASGKYSSVSEVVRAALRFFEQEENKTKSLVNELKIGEKSNKIRNFDREKNLEQLNANFQK
jgi:antitoxin ParD1/3/4